MSDDPYVYPGTCVLLNKLGIADLAQLDYHEREIVTMRAREGIPTGDFDLKHLRAVHRHLFQDVYEWAGEIRTVEISKGGSQFQFRQYIETGMADVHRRLVKASYMKSLSVRLLRPRRPQSLATSTMSIPSARAMVARSCIISSNCPPMPDTRLI